MIGGDEACLNTTFLEVCQVAWAYSIPSWSIQPTREKDVKWGQFAVPKLPVGFS